MLGRFRIWQTGFDRPFDSNDVDTDHLVVSYQDERFSGPRSELSRLCRGKITDSLVKRQVVGKTVALSSTMQNVTTIRRLAALHQLA